MTHYVLVCAGHADPAGTIEARQTFEKLLLLLLTERFWPHGVDHLPPPGPQPGDPVLFCLATSHGPELIGDAVVSAPSVPLTDPQLAECRLYLGPVMPPGRNLLTHVMGLDCARVWEKGCTIGDQENPLAFELARALSGIYTTGAVRPISEEAYRWVADHRACPDPPVPTPPAVTVEPAPPARCPKVDTTRDFLSTHWALVDFGEALRPLDDTANESGSETGAGAVDFLCRSEQSGDLVAVVCVNGEPLDRLQQGVQGRLAWLRGNVAQDGQRVRALLLATDATTRIDSLAGADIDVRRLQVVCSPSQPLAVGPTEVGEWKHAVRSEPSPVAPPLPAPAVAAIVAEPEPLDFAARCLQAARRGLNGTRRWPVR